MKGFIEVLRVLALVAIGAFAAYVLVACDTKIPEAKREVTGVITPAPVVETLPVEVVVPKPEAKPVAKLNRAQGKLKTVADQEAAAYAKAERNALRVVCLTAVVDAKIEYDVRRGTISDLGNARDEIGDAECKQVFEILGIK